MREGNVKMRMKWFLAGGLLCSLLLSGAESYACPSLQLDIAGGTYNTTTQTIVATGKVFTLYAYLIIDGSPPRTALLEDTYFISAAVVPKTAPPGEDRGTFTFGGAEIAVTGDMVYGVPPLEANLTSAPDCGDLPDHGIFETYYEEFGFKFLQPGETVGADGTAAGTGVTDNLTGGVADTFSYTKGVSGQYDTQDDTGIGPQPGTGMYYVALNIDTSNLNAGTAIHFDLYNEKVKTGDTDVNKFAPFSHDAQSVPEPGSLLLIGSGLLGLALFRRKFRG